MKKTSRTSEKNLFLDKINFIHIKLNYIRNYGDLVVDF